MVLSLLVVMLIQHGDQFELQWDIQSLLALNMLLLGMKIVGRNTHTTKVFFFNLVYLMKINERCSYTKLDRQFYFCSGNYLVFYNAIKKAYPDIKIISNCDGSSQPLDHPADYYDFHVKNIHRQTFMIANQTVFMHLLFLVSGL